MINHHGTWLLSVRVGIPFIIFGIVVCLAAFAICFYASKDSGQWEIIGIFGPFIGLALLGLIIGSAFGYYPYKSDYHRLQPISGTITSIDSRYLATSQYLVMTFDSGLTVRCDDSRCVTVHIGDNLRLLCTKEHSGGSPLETDGWGCRWGE